MSSDIVDLIKGRGNFLGDDAPRGTLHVAFARSDLAHAVIRDVDLPSVDPGVVAIHTAESLSPPVIPAQARPTAPQATGMERHALAVDRVRYVGEPVAMVLARSPELAEDAADGIWIDFEELPAVIDPDHAVRDEVLVFPSAGTNVVTRSERGRAAEPLPADAVTIDLRIRHTRLSAAPIETLGVMAIPADGRIEVWCGHQAPHRLLRALNTVFGFTRDELRVRVPDVGGAFGHKGPLYPEYVAVVAAAIAHQRPVLWRERRRENFAGGTHGRGMLQRVRMTGHSTGEISALRLDILADLGAYPQTGFMVPETAALMTTGPYRVTDAGATVTSVVTNTAPTGPYRGAGRPEAAMAVERAIDEYARRIEMEPSEVRRMNLLGPDELPHRSPTGAMYDSGDYQRALDRALEMIDLRGFRARQAHARANRLNPLGLGLATFVEPAGGPPTSGEYGSVELDEEGRVTARVGSTPAGQPHDRVWQKLVAGVFDIAPSDVVVVSGDTDLVSRGEGTFGSRSTQTAGAALVRTATRLLELARDLAAGSLEAAPGDLRIQDGGFVVAGSPSHRVELSEIPAIAKNNGVELFEEEFHVPGSQTFPYGTHAAIVEVDRDTGEVKIERIVAVDDCGSILDHPAVEGQLSGGLVQGVGQALFEGIQYSPTGQLLTSSMMDYAIPRASDIPQIDLDYYETPALTQLGVKGVGESGIVGAPTAILNAVLDALAPDGVREVDLPLRSAKVWEAMRRSAIENA